MQLKQDFVVSQRGVVFSGDAIRFGSQKAVQAFELLIRVIQLNLVEQQPSLPDVARSQFLLGDAQQRPACHGFGLSGREEGFAAQRGGQAIQLASGFNLARFGKQVAAVNGHKPHVGMFQTTMLFQERVVPTSRFFGVFELPMNDVRRRQLNPDLQRWQLAELLIGLFEHLFHLALAAVVSQGLDQGLVQLRTKLRIKSRCGEAMLRQFFQQRPALRCLRRHQQVQKLVLPLSR